VVAVGVRRMGMAIEACVFANGLDFGDDGGFAGDDDLGGVPGVFIAGVFLLATGLEGGALP
jgi:hypothetical protein